MGRISCPPPWSVFVWLEVAQDRKHRFLVVCFSSTLSFSSSATIRGPLEEKVGYRSPGSGQNILQFLILCTLTRSLPSLWGGSFLSLAEFTAGQDWWLLFSSAQHLPVPRKLTPRAEASRCLPTWLPRAPWTCAVWFIIQVCANKKPSAREWVILSGFISQWGRVDSPKHYRLLLMILVALWSMPLKPCGWGCHSRKCWLDRKELRKFGALGSILTSRLLFYISLWKKGSLVGLRSCDASKS